MRVSLTSGNERKQRAAVHEELVRLGYIKRYTFDDAAFTIQDCTEQEVMRLLNMCYELKRKGVIVEFEIKWTKQMEGYTTW